MRLYIDHASLLRLRVPLPPMQDGANPADVFDFGAYMAEQRARTAEVADRMPTALAMVTQLNRELGKDQQHPERTLKSYVLQEAEGISREAKLEWCKNTRCKWINLQHDGVIIRLTEGWTPEAAASDLTRVVSAAVGYAQSVERKAWAAGAGFSSPLPELQLTRRMGDLTVEDVLKTMYKWLHERQYIRGASNTKPGAKTAYAPDGTKDTGESAFVAKHSVAYLYGVDKTHQHFVLCSTPQ